MISIVALKIVFWWREGDTDEPDACLARTNVSKRKVACGQAAVEQEEEGALPSSEKKPVVEACCHGNSKHKMSRL